MNSSAKRRIRVIRWLRDEVEVAAGKQSARFSEAKQRHLLISKQHLESGLDHNHMHHCSATTPPHLPLHEPQLHSSTILLPKQQPSGITMASNNVPDEAPPSYAQATGSSSSSSRPAAGASSSNTAGSHLNVPGASSGGRNGIPAEYRKSMEDEVSPRQHEGDHEAQCSLPFTDATSTRRLGEVIRR